MPKENVVQQQIPALYKQNTYNLLMFGYVRGVRGTLHTLTIDQALLMFAEDMGIPDDDFNLESSRTTFNKLTNYLIQSKRTTNE